MAKTKARVLISHTFDPWFNIATEDWIFREMDPDVQTLFLWRNQDTVVIGRNQNPWSECNLSRMETDGVKLARRMSGGGAVFHDLGNTCFTFLSPRQGYDRKQNLGIVLRALERFGIVGEASGRNDITVPAADGPRKVSGSAFRETRDRAFHHGTLLINSDLGRLENYLTPHPKKLASKGRASVRSRVMNLAELNARVDHAGLSSALIEEFLKTHGAAGTPIEILDPLSLESMGSLQDTFQSFSSWEWRFGHAPKFEMQMTEALSWGLVELHIDADHGRIERVKLFSDALFPELIESLEGALRAKTFNAEGIESAIGETAATHPERGAELAELAIWLKREIQV